MKLLMPELDYSQAFSNENDLFGRKGLALNLENIITNSDDDSLVIGLDDKWGSGKTTFLKMWEQKVISDDNFKIVYYDSFKNDFQSDPFISISSEIYKLIDKDDLELKKKFIDVTKRVGATLLKASFKIGVTLATAGLVQGSSLEGFNDDIVSNINEPIEKLIEKKLIEKENEELTLTHFKETLEEIGSEKKLIFIIDELDRARPDFSLELLEKIKHIFQAKNIVFILSVNKEQFQHTIQKSYGMIDSETYLNKFVHFWFKLTKEEYDRKSVEEIYMEKLYQELKGENAGFEDSLRAVSILIKATDSSLRDAERCFSLVLMMNATSQSGFEWKFQVGIGITAFLKVKKPTLYEKILKNRVSYDQVREELNLSKEINPENGKRDEILINQAMFVQTASNEEFREYVNQNGRIEFSTDSGGQLKTLSNVKKRFKDFI